MSDIPRTIEKEIENATEVARRMEPYAGLWRGDVRLVEGGLLVAGCHFNLVDDSNINDLKHSQFRVLALVQAPEGYVAVWAIAANAVPSQLPTVRISQVIKSSMEFADAEVA